MGVLSIYHPDIEDFIYAKSKEANRLNHFNLSVMVDDNFMRAVENNSNITLHYPVYDEKYHIIKDKSKWKYEKEVSARELWDKIMKLAYVNGEPGIMFYDNMNKMNNTWYTETITHTNPCSEYIAGTVFNQELSSDQYAGACNLGSLMLHNFVENPFTDTAYFDFSKLSQTIKVAVRMLDNIIDINTFPLPQYENYQKNFRTIGLGVTGLADMLVMLGYKYNSKEAVDFVDALMESISICAYYSSIELSKEKGPFPFLDAEKFVKSGFITAHKRGNNGESWKEISNLIEEYGIRNARILSVAPCGTMSLTFGNNCSSGIEPIFSLGYDRKVKIGGQNEENEKIIHISDYAYENCPNKEKAPFITAQEMTVQEHINMLAVIAKHVDMSVSKTINVPTDYSFEDTKNIYFDCWKKGIKGCTIFRPNEIRQGILLTETPKKEEEVKEERKLGRGEIKIISDDVIGKKRRLISGCVDGETEFFTGYGWKKISEYKKGDKVLQYNADGTASLVEPLDYIKRKSAGQYHIVSKYGIDMMVSPDHRNVVFNDFNNNFNIMTTEEIIKQHNELKCGFYKKFKLSFNYNGKGINLTDDEIRISVAIFADGCFYSPTSKKVLISVRKKRKRNRLIMLLENAGIDYNENLDGDGYYNIKFYPPIEGRVKQFPEEWYNCSQHQLQVIFDEAFKWDGYEKNNNEYTTVIKSNADFIQFVCAATGHRGSIYIDNSFDKYTEKSYRVDWSDRAKAGIQEKKKKQIEFVKDVDYDYCFSVPSTMLVLRRNNRIFITGNCGSLHCAAYFDRTTGELLEVFLDKGSAGGCDNFMTGLSRMISLAARAGCSIYDIVDQLNSSGTCPSYAVRRATKHDTSPGSSCPVAVGNALLDMQIEINEELEIDNPKPIIKKKEIKSVILPKYKCPECGSEITFEGGCQTCKNCGWSKCS